MSALDIPDEVTEAEVAMVEAKEGRDAVKRVGLEGAYLVKRRTTAAEGGDTRIPARVCSGPKGTWLD